VGAHTYRAYICSERTPEQAYVRAAIAALGCTIRVYRGGCTHIELKRVDPHRTKACRYTVRSAYIEVGAHI
jgi:hypothetical protein